ncbi:beta-1,3-galactosyltransferase 1-like [Biomphalaria glabrata]|uniref:Hexosyltransferase n=1 Tax=Biomphalaria glabrata TaxID=6526 RepID=A0A9U8DX88_BIOGL|nr:beta-1,3-galactosyltransferase 1-like [Biomphalaria glabrata]
MCQKVPPARQMMYIAIVMTTFIIFIYTMILSTFSKHSINHAIFSADLPEQLASTFKRSTFHLMQRSNHEKTGCESDLTESLPSRDSISSSVSSERASQSPVSTTISWSPETSHASFFTGDFFRNISRKKEGNKTLLYYTIKDESYLKENVSFFTIRNETNNDLNFTFLIKGDNVCEKVQPFLLIVIPSVVAHKDRRDAIRRTWLRASESNYWPRVNIRTTVRHVFVFGYRNHSLKEDLRDLQQESYVNNDIVMVKFVDTYRNLTLKMLSAFTWMQQYCGQTQFLLKVDEDTFINVPLMIELLRRVHTAEKDMGLVIGHRHENNRPNVVRDTGNRWEVDTSEYPLTHYPRYLVGPSYAVSRSAVGMILAASRSLRLIAPEDAFITGIAAKSSGVLRLTAPSFSTCCSTAADCDLVWNKKVSMTSSPSVKNIEAIWTNIAKQFCEDDDSDY